MYYQFPPSTITNDKPLKRFIPTLSLILLGSSPIQDALPQEKSTARLTTLAKASPLSEDAITSDWPRFNGPDDNAKSSETKLLKKWPEDGPKLLWEIRKGEGYASPAIKDGTLILFHRIEEKEMIEAVDAEKGTPLWQFEYPVE